MTVTSVPRRLLATASLTAALACGGLAFTITTGPAAAATASASPTPAVSAGPAVVAATTGSDNHTGRWGLAGLTGMVGLFGYKKYIQYRATRSGTGRVGGTDNDRGGSTRA